MYTNTTRNLTQNLLIALFALIYGLESQAQISGLAWRTNVGARLFAVDGYTNVYANAKGTVIVLNADGKPLQTNAICPLPSIARRDSNGNYYFTGSFDGTNDFGGTVLVGGSTMVGSKSCFLAKYSGQGSLQWGVSFGELQLSDRVTDLLLDTNDTIYVAYTHSGAGTIARFDSSGGLQWNQTIDTAGGIGATRSVSLAQGATSVWFAAYHNTNAVYGSYDLSGNLGGMDSTTPLTYTDLQSTNGIVVLDNLNQFYQVGTFYDSTTKASYQALRKSGSDGSVLSNERISPDAGWILARDSQSNLYVSGPKGTLAKYTIDGALISSNNFNFPGVAMIIAPSGDCFVSFSNGSIGLVKSNAWPYSQFKYTTNAGAITITGYNDVGGDAVIPGTINGYPVVSIGDYAFGSCFTLPITGVTIPNGVTNIGTGAFRGCPISSVVIPDSVISIGNTAFQECNQLTNITLSANLTSIGNSAFYRSPLLTTIAIPSNVTNIGALALLCGPNLKEITVDPFNSSYSSADGVLFDKSQNRLIQYPAANAGTAYAIPQTVTSIGEDAFLGCTNLTNIAMPDDLASVGDHAFDSCSNLGSITIPDHATNLGDYAFAGCSQLGSVTLGNGLTGIGNEAFDYCSSLTNLTIGNSVTWIGNCAFESCSNLTQIIMPDTVTSIGRYAFAKTCLNNVRISTNATVIDNLAFSNCTNLTKITIPASVTTIGYQAFVNCSSLREIYFQGDAPSSLGGCSYTFQGDYNLVAYIASGTTGWEPYVPGPGIIAGFLGVSWSPQIQTTDGSFGLGANGFGFTITNDYSPMVVVEACTNLAASVWTPVQTNRLTGGSCYFSDPQPNASCFYRLRMP